jgi:peptidylprolyl isomerase
MVTTPLAACGGSSASNTEPTTAASPTGASAAGAAGSTRSEDRKARAKSAERRSEGKLRMSKQEIARLPKLEIEKLSGPVPKRLVVRDLRKGTGAEVKQGDAITVKFFSVRYRQARLGSHHGGYGPEKFGMNDVIEGWALGLPGMKVGGRRELIVPPRIGHEGSVLVYVIDLLAVERGGAVTF